MISFFHFVFQKHVPTFIEASDQLGQKGVDTVAVVSVNDHFVMKAWGEKLNAGDKVKFFADPDGSFTKAIHMDMNLGGEHYPYEE